jgi:ubiquinone/menaquinone biosynthesis C-methylase UbiE
MHSAPKIYSPEYYQQLYNLEREHWWCRGMREIASSILDKKISQPLPIKVLDAGCGTGLFLEWLKQYTSEQVIGVDISKEALSFCQRNKGVNTYQASVVELPFASESFGLITCNDVLQHVPSKDIEVLKEFYRVLKPGGLLYLRTNAEQRFAAKDDLSADYHRYSFTELEEKAKTLNFQILRATYVNSVPSVIADLRNYLQSKRTHSSNNGYSGLVMRVPPFGLNQVLYLFLKVEAFYLNRQNRPIPFGHSLVFLLQKPK